MYNQDVPTAVQYGAPVTWVILNTSSLGWTKYSQQLLGERYIAVDFEIQPDFIAMARAFHCQGERVEDPSQIRPALERALQATHNGKPAILDVVVDPDDHPEGFIEVKPLKNEPRKKYL
jgi:acetolactate synthase-1/2/3 large subunit